MTIEKTIIAIPARLESKRFPRKLLAKIDNESILERVIKQCAIHFNKEQIFLCTDSLEIENLCKKWEIQVIMTSRICNSGTERIASVLDKIISKAWKIDLKNKEKIKFLKKTLIINVQADQPYINPEIIKSIDKKFRKSKNGFSILTPIYKLGPKKIHDPNIVKTIIDKNKNALYFSRSTIPYIRDKKFEDWHKFATFYGHVGVYGYRANILRKWRNLSSSSLEKMEALEQLKFLEAGIQIKTFLISGDVQSIDTKKQLIKMKKNIELK